MHAAEAYTLLDAPGTLGILIEYPDSADTLATKTIALTAPVAYSAGAVVCSFIGGGNYASRVLIPAFAAAGARLDTLVTSGGVSAAHQGNKHGFASASTDLEAALAAQAVNTDSHCHATPFTCRTSRGRAAGGQAGICRKAACT